MRRNPATWRAFTASGLKTIVSWPWSTSFTAVVRRRRQARRRPEARRPPARPREGAQQATESTRVHTAVIRCLQAIEAAAGRIRRAAIGLNSSEIALALAGEHSATERFLRVWGDDRPALRVVG